MVSLYRVKLILVLDELLPPVTAIVALTSIVSPGRNVPPLGLDTLI